MPNTSNCKKEHSWDWFVNLLWLLIRLSATKYVLYGMHPYPLSKYDNIKKDQFYFQRLQINCSKHCYIYPYIFHNIIIQWQYNLISKTVWERPWGKREGPTCNLCVSSLYVCLEIIESFTRHMLFITLGDLRMGLSVKAHSVAVCVKLTWWN